MLALVLLLALLASRAEADMSYAEARARAGGWSFLVDRLVADGVPRERVAAAFGDPRVPPFDALSFSLAPREAAGPYRRLLRAPSIRFARQCRARNASAFAAAEAREGVPASLLAAIMHVESACGRTTGGSLVFHRLARLAMANEPANLLRNLLRHTGDSADPFVADQVRRRARYLEDTFYPEVRATFAVADRLGIDPLDLRGSPSGAFGFPQFLPTSYLRDGADGDGDGRVTLYDMSDAAVSCARYLVRSGWRADLTRGEQRDVLWHYNRSGVYIDTVLALHRALEPPAQPDRMPRSKPRPRARRPHR